MQESVADKEMQRKEIPLQNEDRNGSEENKKNRNTNKTKVTKVTK